MQQVELEEMVREKEHEGFKVTDINSLNWVFRKMAAIQAKQKEIKDFCDEERQRIEQWERSQLEPLQGDYDFFQSHVTEYHQKMLAEDPKAKTLSTPYGKSKSRLSKEQPAKTDDNKLIEHIKASGQLEYIKESVAWGDYKKALHVAEINGQKVVVDELGQTVDGAEVKAENVTYTVEIS